MYGVIFALFLAGATDQYCLDRMAVYLIVGCLALIFILVAVIVLCSYGCVSWRNAKKRLRKLKKQCKQKNIELDGFVPDAAEHNNDERDRLSLFTSPSDYPELTLLPKCASEADMTKIQDQKEFLATLPSHSANCEACST